MAYDITASQLLAAASGARPYVFKSTDPLMADAKQFALDEFAQSFRSVGLSVEGYEPQEGAQ